jgi:type II secretory pathway component PulF
LLLRSGTNFPDALTLLQQMETGSPAAKDLALWKERLTSGRRRFTELAAGGGTFPALFVWLVDASGEDWMAGFQHAAAIYRDRALQRVDMLLYAALPFSVLCLGLLVLSQAGPMMRLFSAVMRGLADPLTEF